MALVFRGVSQIERRWVKVGGVCVHYRYRPGRGPALLLLPGGMLDTSAFTWKALLETLPERYRIISPDMPGYGASEKPDAPYTTAYYVRFLRRFLDAMEVERACLFGSSMSGAVVLGFALQAPARVDRMVLSGAYGFQRRLPLHEAAYLLSRLPGADVLAERILHLSPLVVRCALPLAVHDRRRITDELVRDAFQAVRRDRALWAFRRWLRSEVGPHRVRSCYLDRLPELTMPVLLLHGAHDWMMPPRGARRAHRLLPNAALHLFPKSGHLVPREEPEAVNHLVARFLASAS